MKIIKVLNNSNTDDLFIKSIDIRHKKYELSTNILEAKPYSMSMAIKTVAKLSVFDDATTNIFEIIDEKK